MFFDYQFYYYNIARFIFLQKSITFNTEFQIPRINKIESFFTVKRITQLDDPRGYNYYYFFRYFFGIQPHVSEASSVFINNKTYWSYTVKADIRKNLIFTFLFFISYELLPYVNNTVATKWSFTHNNKEIIRFIFSDINFFTEKKAALGLFELKENWYNDFYINSGQYRGLVKNMFKLHSEYIRDHKKAEEK